jgi:hypothetical protein
MGLKEPDPEKDPPATLEELVNRLSKFQIPKLGPADFENMPPDFPEAENAPVVDSLSVQASRPAGNFGSVKFSRNKPKKKKKKKKR